jgi:hypothetical protein
MLSLVQRIINAFNHVATGYSLVQLLFGESVDHRRGLFPTSTTSSDESMPSITYTRDRMTHLLSLQQTLSKLARFSQEALSSHNISERILLSEESR